MEYFSIILTIPYFLNVMFKTGLLSGGLVRDEFILGTSTSLHVRSLFRGQFISGLLNPFEKRKHFPRIVRYNWEVASTTYSPKLNEVWSSDEQSTNKTKTKTILALGLAWIFLVMILPIEFRLFSFGFKPFNILLTHLYRLRS